MDKDSDLDAAGEWQEHPERQAVVALHTEIMWTLLAAFGERARRESIVKRELNRMIKESLWAVTEIRVGAKYDLRFVSSGVANECRRSGPLRNWAYLPNSARPCDINHEHVFPKRLLKAALYEAATEEDVRAVLESAESCVVTVAEHRALAVVRNDSTGWARYKAAKIVVWDRLLHMAHRPAG